MDIWIIITGIGTILFAAIALFAIFYPDIKKYYNGPKLSIKINVFGLSGNKSGFIEVTNIGKNPAYGLRLLIKSMKDADKNVLVEGAQLPMRGMKENDTIGEIYNGFDLYPSEKVSFQIIHYGARRTGQPKNLVEMTCYPWMWTSDSFAPLNSFDNKKFIVDSKNSYQIEVLPVDKNHDNKQENYTFFDST